MFSVAVINWQAFEFEPIRIVINLSTEFIDNCPCVMVVLFCAVAYTLLTRPNQVETAVQSLYFWLSVWVYRVIFTLSFSFLLSVSLAVIVLSLYF